MMIIDNGPWINQMQGLRKISYSVQCVILAGGLGSRMAAYTGGQSKHLIHVLGRPFAHYQLTWLAGHGISEVVYCLGHMGESIERYVGDGSNWGLRVRYVYDGEQLLATGGALRRAYEAKALNRWFLVLYGDSFLPFDFQAFVEAFLSQVKPAMMAVYHNRQMYDKGNVRFENRQVNLYMKNAPDDILSTMNWIDYGVSALKREIIDREVPHGEVYDLSVLYNRLSKGGELAGFEVEERFYEVGSISGLKDFEGWLGKNKRLF